LPSGAEARPPVSHGKNIYDLLQRVMPDWQSRKMRLERMMAAQDFFCKML